MKNLIHFLSYYLFFTSCANIVLPTGGEKDITPPKLLKTSINNNSINFQDDVITFIFDENIAANMWGENFCISPLTDEPAKFKIKGRVLSINLKGILKEKTTYNLNLNNCIKDINEGNVLDSLRFSFSTGDSLDSLMLFGTIVDALTLETKSGIRVFLQDTSVVDSLCFLTQPKHVTKTNNNGEFLFTNLNDHNYKIFCVSGSDYSYHENDDIGFYDNLINAQNSKPINLVMYDPLLSETEKRDTVQVDTLQKKINDTKIRINCNVKENVIIQLYNGKEIEKEIFLNKSPYLIENISPGIYNLKIILDKNKNNIWDKGNFSATILPEKVFIYKEKINLRENWTLELDCIVN